MPGYLIVLRRHLALLLGVTVLAVAGAVGFSLLQAPRWQAVATVQLDQVDSPFRASGGTKGDLTRALQTQVDLARSDAVRTSVRSRLGSVPPVDIGPHGQTDELQFSAEASTGAGAARAANAWADSYRDVVATRQGAASVRAQQVYDDQFNVLQHEISTVSGALPTALPREAERLRLRREVLITQLKAIASRQDTSRGQSVSSLSVTPLREAVAPRSPSTPGPVSAGLIGLLAGLLGGFVLACAVEAVRDRVRSAVDVRLVGSAAPVLGPVQVVATDVPALLRDRAAVMDLQAVRAEVSALTARTSPAVLAVTGPRGDEGAAAVATALALLLARTGRRVALVDTDLDRPAILDLLGGASGKDLGRELGDGWYLHQGGSGEPLTVVTSEALDMEDELSSPGLASLVGALLERVEVVVLAAPALLTSADALTVVEVATTSVVVASVGRTSRRDLKAALARLALVDQALSAIVLASPPPRFGQLPDGSSTPAPDPAGVDARPEIVTTRAR